MHELLQTDFEEIARCALPWEKLKDKTILCTGATGFLVGYFVQFLRYIDQRKNLGLKLYLFQRGTKQKLVRHAERVYMVLGDITQDFLCEDIKPDIIIHAASPANQKNIAYDPEGVVNTNILATHYLLEQARINHSVFLYFSSGAVYPHMETPVPEVEFSPIKEGSWPETLYGRCKATGELLCHTYHQQYGVDCRIVRPFSIYGPGEALDSGRCFTDLLSQTLRGEPVKLTSAGRQIRGYCYQSDFTSGLLYILLKGTSTVYNHGNEENNCSIKELAELVSRLGTDKGVQINQPAAEKNEPADIYLPNTEKLRILGWQPKVDLSACIERTLAYYSKNQ